MRRTVWFLLGIVTAACAIDKAEVEAIVEKLERVNAVSPSVTVGFAIYDPFKKTEPMIKKAKPVRRFVPVKPVPRLMALAGKRAFIDRRWVGVGERVSGWTVQAITAKGVWVDNGQKRLFLPIKPRRTLLEAKDTKR